MRVMRRKMSVARECPFTRAELVSGQKPEAHCRSLRSADQRTRDSILSERNGEKRGSQSGSSVCN